MNNPISLTGLNGGNLLGFLSAVGLLKLCEDQGKLGWLYQGKWIPQFYYPGFNTMDELLDLAWNRLQEWQLPSVLEKYENTNKFGGQEYLTMCQSADDAPTMEWLSALACFGVEEKGALLDTGFRTMSGAGAQHFLKTIRDLRLKVGPKHLQEALTGPWTYEDDRLTLRFDPQDDRRSALRWALAGDEPTRSVWGANLLAAVAVGCFVSTPTNQGLQTIGFFGRRSREIALRWPIWEAPVSLSVVRSLISLADIQKLTPPNEAQKESGETERIKQTRATLAARGVLEVYQSRRLTIGKIRNFAPAESL